MTSLELLINWRTWHGAIISPTPRGIPKPTSLLQQDHRHKTSDDILREMPKVYNTDNAEFVNAWHYKLPPIQKQYMANKWLHGYNENTNLSELIKNNNCVLAYLINYRNNNCKHLQMPINKGGETDFALSVLQELHLDLMMDLLIKFTICQEKKA